MLCFNDAFQIYIHEFMRRVRGYDITLNLEIYSPGIGVCNIACIPQKELQNLTRGRGIQGLNIETSSTRKAFWQQSSLRKSMCQTDNQIYGPGIGVKIGGWG